MSHIHDQLKNGIPPALKAYRVYHPLASRRSVGRVLIFSWSLGLFANGLNRLCNRLYWAMRCIFRMAIKFSRDWLAFIGVRRLATGMKMTQLKLKSLIICTYLSFLGLFTKGDL